MQARDAGVVADDRFGSSLCGNSEVELARRNFVSITLNRKRTALAVTLEKNKMEKTILCTLLLVHLSHSLGHLRTWTWC